MPFDPHSPPFASQVRPKLMPAEFDRTQVALQATTAMAEAAAAGPLLAAAANPDTIIVGTITRDSNGAATSAPVVWPDGVSGTYTGTASAVAAGAVDSYSITHLGTTTTTYTQPTVTRDGSGAVVVRPAIVVT